MPESGAPVSVALPFAALDPSHNVVARSSYGYPDESGHIAQAAFDVTGKRVYVSRFAEPDRVTSLLDLRTGRWTTLPAATLQNTDRGVVLLALDAGVLTVTTTGDTTEVESVARVDVDPERFTSEIRVQRFVWNDTEQLLVVAGGNGSPVIELGYFERRASGWQPSPTLLPSSVGLAHVTVSASGARACIVGTDQSVWLADRQQTIRVDVGFLVEGCSFSPEERLVALNGAPTARARQLGITDQAGVKVAEFEGFVLQGNLDGFAYGTNGTDLVRLDWSTLELQTLPSPAWCKAEPDAEGIAFHRVLLVGSNALVEAYCRSLDSHYSGVYLLPLTAGASPEPLFAPRAWDILQIAPLADGSALIAQLAYGDEELPNAGDRFSRVTPDGRVTEVGPFPDVPTPLHAPVGASFP